MKSVTRHTHFCKQNMVLQDRLSLKKRYDTIQIGLTKQVSLYETNNKDFLKLPNNLFGRYNNSVWKDCINYANVVLNIIIISFINDEQ